MLWYKSWLETRWRFLAGFALLICAAVAAVLSYPRAVREVLPLVPSADVGGVIGGQIRETADLFRTYRGYVWAQWFRQNLAETWTIFAVLLGTGGLLRQAARGGALYTLSMPASRTRLLGVRAATGLAELFVLAVIPSLVFPLLSPLVGQTYGIGDAVVHSVCLFIAGSVFFSLAFLLSTVFGDVWRPLLIALCAAFGLGLFEQAFHDALPSSFFVMTAESYFRGNGVPWFGVLTRIAASAGLLYGAVLNMARQDF